MALIKQLSIIDLIHEYLVAHSKHKHRITSERRSLPYIKILTNIPGAKRIRIVVYYRPNHIRAIQAKGALKRRRLADQNKKQHTIAVISCVEDCIKILS